MKKTGKPLSLEMRAKLAYLAAQQWARTLSNPEIALAFVNGELDAAQQRSVPEVAAELDGLYSAATAIATERREKLKRLRDALLRDDDGTALRIAAALCGVKDDEESNRTHPRIH
jgi:hypothetical protein